MLSAVFLVFFVGAIAALEENLDVPLCLKRSGLFELLLMRLDSPRNVSCGIKLGNASPNVS